jgi:two-component system nitrogen regulation sensor histidine kinase NtrY
MKRLEHRIALGVLVSLAPLLLAVAWLLFGEEHSPGVRWAISIVALLSLGIGVAVIRAQRDRPLRTLANLISAIREEDYSIRARGSSRNDAMSEVARELNLLAATLRERRLGEREATALVRAVLEHIDSAIFAFDKDGHLRLANRAGEHLLGRSAEQLANRSAADLGLEAFLDGAESRIAEMVLPGGHGKFRIRRTTFRENGVPHVMLSLSDLSRTLREEERQAWQNLLRVLSHELNNSLAPIRSIAGSLASILAREPLPATWQEDARHGLEVIGDRAEALTRFLQAYTQLTRLPRPDLRPMNVGETVRRVAGLETRITVRVEAGPDVTIRADCDQIEQLLINLVHNGVDAALETSGEVAMSWSATADAVEIRVIDDGEGISGTANLFVPFFTTKPGGTGIGLVLARQIAEAHDGSLTLSNRSGAARGTIARLRLPVG